MPPPTQLLTAPRRLLLLTGLAAVIGLIGGGAAWVLVRLIGLITHLALFGELSWEEPPPFTELPIGPTLVIVPVLGALVVALLAKWAPQIKGHGIPESMEAILTRQSRVQPRMAVAKPTSAAVAIGTGGPFGAEGPIIVTGGALGSLIGQVLPVSPSERKILLASGAAAGMAAIFGSPLAAVVLAIELLLFEFSTRAFVPLVVATSVAGGMHVLLFSEGTFFSIPAHDVAGLGQLPLFAVVGLACGLLAVVVNKGLFAVEHGFRRLPVGEFWHPVVGALAFGTVGLAVPTALGVGYDRISAVLNGELAVGALAVLCVGKLVVWWLALGSGTSGGTLAPLLLIGGTFGALLGHAAGAVVPGLELPPGVFALVGMAATFGAATKATFTSIVFLFEITGDYDLILPLMLASVVADLVAAWVVDDRLMTEKLTRRGVRVQGDYQADVLAAHQVHEVMSTEVATVPAGATVAEARRRFEATRHGAYPLVDDDGRCVGVVGRSGLLRSTDEEDESAPVVDVASRDVVSVSTTTSVLDALHVLLSEEVEHLPVPDAGGHLVGICTRTDVLSTRRRQLEHERPQPGWGSRAAMPRMLARWNGDEEPAGSTGSTSR